MVCEIITNNIFIIFELINLKFLYLNDHIKCLANYYDTIMVIYSFLTRFLGSVYDLNLGHLKTDICKCSIYTTSNPILLDSRINRSN